MKRISLLSYFLPSLLLPLIGMGQVSPVSPSGNPASLSNIVTSGGMSVTTWQANRSDSQSTEWQRIQLGSNAITGVLELQTNHYTEVANNLNFLNSAAAWEDSRDSIILTTNTSGAAALFGPTKVYFPPIS